MATRREAEQLTTEGVYDDIIAEHVPLVLAALRCGADAAREAELVSLTDGPLKHFIEAIGGEVEHSIKVERTVIVRDADNPKSRARIDRLFNTVVVEFEPPRSLRLANEATTNKHAIQQVKEQVDALIEHEGFNPEKVSGLACDGARFIFCRRTGGEWIVESPLDVDERSTARFLRLIATIRRPALLPELVAKRFGITQEDVTIGTIREFFEALKEGAEKRSGALLGQWKEFYADVAGLDVEKLSMDKDLSDFARKITGKKTVSGEDLSRVLFSTYTFGAMLMKLLAVTVVTPFFTDKVSNPLSRLAGMGDQDLVKNLQAIENGSWFKNLGFANLCEGDFFSWYVGEWSPGVARQVKRVIDELDSYDPSVIEQTPERVRDLMKRIYHSLLPRKVRKTLGEYYTPDWLAERTLTLAAPVLWDEGIPQAKKSRVYSEEIVPMLRNSRWLDPTCGSGTFLVMLLSRLKLHWTIARQMTKPESDELIDCPSKGDFVRSLLLNVNGFDLNPLAVIASRVNFMLAIVDLLDPDEIRKNPIEIPVYLADSIALPQTDEGQNLLAEGNFMLPMRGIGKTFPVPVALATEDRMPKLATLLERDVSGGVEVEVFLTSARQTFALKPHEWQASEPALKTLFSTLDSLHRAGQNGLWAAVAKNMFMPLFLDPVDFVVGNPPWVNWEGLPEAYRQASKGLWQEMGLFVHTGMDVMLGKSKKDISTLSAYVSSDRYLKRGGKLAFVITQSVFKTTGAGQGFRRFKIGNTGDSLSIQAVEDFTDFQPFEDATNRTAVFVWEKGRETCYPMKNYRQWKKTGREKPDFWATWTEASQRLSSIPVWAEPIDANDVTSSWLTVSKDALRAIKKVLGRSEYRAYAGAYSGGCNPVYWLQLLRTNADGTVDVRMITDGAKTDIPEPHRHTIEPDLLYPMLRSSEVDKWRATPEDDCYFLMMQDPAKRIGWPEHEIRRKFPRLYGYLNKYRDQLLARGSKSVKALMQRGAFYSMFAVGEYTFAPCKVVWPNMGAVSIKACVVSGKGQPTIPQHIITMIPFADEGCDEAHYCAAVMNSTPFQLATIAYSQTGGKSFGTPHILEYSRLPKMDTSNRQHVRLAGLSREAHNVALGNPGRLLGDIEREIDELAAGLWLITRGELQAMQLELSEVIGN